MNFQVYKEIEDKITPSIEGLRHPDIAMLAQDAKALPETLIKEKALLTLGWIIRYESLIRRQKFEKLLTNVLGTI